MPAHHLVAHLHRIPPIEELMADEGVVLQGLGVRVQGAGRLERSGRGGLSSRRWPVPSDAPAPRPGLEPAAGAPRWS